MDVLNLNFTDYLKYGLALIFVLSLVGIFGLIARRAGFGLSASVHGKRQRRLAIVETMNVDGKRKLVLFKRDNAEHLVLLGTGSDLLIESVATPRHNAFSEALNEAAQASKTGERLDIPVAPGEQERSYDPLSGRKGSVKGRGPEFGS